VITGTHTVVFCEDPEAARAFFRDVLELASVDAGDGWLIFRLPPAELGIHPGGPPEARHELWLMCDDVERTVDDLRVRGVEITAEVSSAGFGRTARFRVPGAGEMWLYEPSHPTAV
jgi:catechol 2,3-dioxygenase-like lactoylglutathione lyase family enzyme